MPDWSGKLQFIGGGLRLWSVSKAEVVQRSCRVMQLLRRWIPNFIGNCAGIANQLGVAVAPSCSCNWRDWSWLGKAGIDCIAESRGGQGGQGFMRSYPQCMTWTWLTVLTNSGARVVTIISLTLPFVWFSDLMFFWPSLTHSLFSLPPPPPQPPNMWPNVYLLPNFEKKSAKEVIGILRKVSTTIECFQAIFDKKHLFKNLDSEHQHSLHCFTDQLNWISGNFDKADTWLKQHHKEILWACQCVRTVEFSMLKELLVCRYWKVTKDLVHTVNSGYLDWIIL